MNLPPLFVAHAALSPAIVASPSFYRLPLVDAIVRCERLRSAGGRAAIGDSCGAAYDALTRFGGGTDLVGFLLTRPSHPN